MDHREDGDHARCRDDHLLRVPVTTRAYHAGAIARCRFAGRCAQGAWHHGFNRDLFSSGILCRNRYLLSAPSLFPRGIRSARAYRSGEALFAPSDFRYLLAVTSWLLCFILLDSTYTLSL